MAGTIVIIVSQIGQYVYYKQQVSIGPIRDKVKSTEAATGIAQKRFNWIVFLSPHIKSFKQSL